MSKNTTNYEIKAYEPTKLSSEVVIRYVKSQNETSAIQEAFGLDVESASFYRKGNDIHDNPYIAYDAIFKTAPINRRVRVTTMKKQVTAIATATTTATAPKAPKAPDTRSDCNATVWVGERNLHGTCMRKELEGTSKCFQHAKYEFPSEGVRATAGFTEAAIERGLDTLYGVKAKTPVKKAKVAKEPIAKGDKSKAVSKTARPKSARRAESGTTASA